MNGSALPSMFAVATATVASAAATASRANAAATGAIAAAARSRRSRSPPQRHILGEIAQQQIRIGYRWQRPAAPIARWPRRRPGRARPHLQHRPVQPRDRPAPGPDRLDRRHRHHQWKVADPPVMRRHRRKSRMSEISGARPAHVHGQQVRLVQHPPQRHRRRRHPRRRTRQQRMDGHARRLRRRHHPAVRLRHQQPRQRQRRHQERFDLREISAMARRA